MAWNRKERRLKRRYEISLALRYVLPTAIAAGGTGQLKNISSSGLLFQSEEHVPIGSPIVVELDCPGPGVTDGGTVSLVMAGHVVRSRRRFLAVTISTHYFRRQAHAPGGNPANHGETILLASEQCEFAEATSNVQIEVLRVTTTVALEILKAGRPQVALVITDNVQEFSEFSGRVHIAGMGRSIAAAGGAQ